MKQSVVLIGGMGFIGRHLAIACCKANFSVRIVDTTSSLIDCTGFDIEYFQGSYRDPLFLRHVLKGANYVVHLAHDTMLLNLECDMNIEFERNILPTIQLMDICCTESVAKLLFVSSGGTIYGSSLKNQPISEDVPTRPISVYGTSKLMVEHLGFLYHVQKDLPFIAARPSNAYGQGQLPFRGQGFIATALASALEKRDLTIFGDGTVVRDYIHVRDIAEALVALVQNGRPGEAYNVSTGHGISLRTLLNDYIVPLVTADGYALNCVYTPKRAADVPYNVITSDKLSRDTGFSPRISLRNGLRDTWEWLKNRDKHTNYL